MTMPVPSAVALLYLSCEVMSTIAGSTLAASACTSSGPEPRLLPLLLPFWPLGAWPRPFPPNGFCWPPLPPGVTICGDCAERERVGGPGRVVGAGRVARVRNAVGSCCAMGIGRAYPRADVLRWLPAAL